MRKILIICLFFVSFFCKAQKIHYDLKTDTITYQYYIKGEWTKLIKWGNESIKAGIDFMYLRQRLGYAYFILGDYYSSQKEYEKALTFEPKDITTLTYLYYCSYYIGNQAVMRYYGQQLNDIQKKSFELKPFKIVNAIDLEYNYKINDNSTRGNPTYMRAGITTDLNYSLSLYQSFSTYGQKHTSITDISGLIPVHSTDTNSIRQNEYFASLNWVINPHLNINFGYHHIGTIINSKNTYTWRTGSLTNKSIKDTLLKLPANLICSRLNYTINRFDIGVCASILKSDTVFSQQYGIHAGLLLPGIHNIYVNSSLYGILETNTKSRLVFSQTAGALFFKNLWVEGSLTLGNLNNYSDGNGLYVYNSLDPTIFRTGITLFWNVLPKVSLFGNYCYDTKLIEENSTNYNQHSFSGGIIWKI